MLKRILLLTLSSISCYAADFQFIYTDSAGFGFNDNSSRTPINGNTGVTLGQQRRQVLEEAGRLLGIHLQSSVPIRVRSSFRDFGCGQFGATLAAAGPSVFSGDFSNMPFPNTSYPTALANSLAGRDLTFGDDISVTVNSAIDGDANCFGGNGYYYGLDRSPQGQGIDLLTVLLHELGHGLGFTSLVNIATGASSSRPDVFTRFIRDISTGQNWTEMSNAQRAASAVNTGNVVFTGPSVNAAASRYLQTALNPTLNFSGNTNITESFQAFIAGFGIQTTNGITGEIILVNDGSTANPTAGGNSGSITDACQFPFINAAEIDGNIALIDRGICNFTDKVIRAEQAGAIAVIIANNVDGTVGLNGTAPFPNIPSVSITLQQGDAIKAALQNGPLTVSFRQEQAATNESFVELHAPNPLQQGSSISHFSQDALPNLLMEPSNSANIDDTLDLTLPLFRDIGWNVIDIPIPHDTYALWADRIIPDNIAERGQTQDADGDGVSNFAEYAFGSDPVSPVSRPPAIDFDFSNDNGTFSYIRNRTPVDIDYLLENSTNLSAWTAVPAGSVIQNPLIQPDGDSQQIDLTIESALQKNFFRINASNVSQP